MVDDFREVNVLRTIHLIIIVVLAIFIIGYTLNAHTHIRNLFFSDAIAQRDSNHEIISHDLTVNVNQINEIIGSYNINLHWVSQNWQEKSDGNVSQKPIIIGVHGTPGGWGAWQDVMNTSWVKEHSQFIAIDRPGWGKSTVTYQEKPTIIYDISQQADIISSLLKHIKQQQPNTPLYLLGHSWGAPVIADIAARYPNLLNGLVVIGGAFEPMTMKPRWYHKMAQYKVIGAVIGRGLRHSNLEMIPLSHQLTQLMNRWQNIQAPTIIIQGEKDYLVDSSNGEFFKTKLINSRVNLKLLKGKGHFIPFNEPEIVVESLKEIVNY